MTRYLLTVLILLCFSPLLEASSGKSKRCELSDLDVGDVFVFKQLRSKRRHIMRNSVPMPFPLMRGISTYGNEDVPPRLWTKYQVVEKRLGIPFKGRRGAEKNLLRETILMIRQVEPTLTEGQEHFWFVNVSTRWVEQFEDGDGLFRIKRIHKVVL